MNDLCSYTLKQSPLSLLLTHDILCLSLTFATYFCSCKELREHISLPLLSPLIFSVPTPVSRSIYVHRPLRQWRQSTNSTLTWCLTTIIIIIIF